MLAESLKSLEAAWAHHPPDAIVFADPIETDSIAYFSAAVAHAAAPAWRVGLAASAVPDGFLDEMVEHGPPVAHELTRMAALAHAAGARSVEPRLPRVPPRVLPPGLPPGPSEAHTRPRVAFHMGASTSVRRWAAERYAELAERLHADTGAEIVLVGAPSEREDAARVFPEGGAVPVTNLVGGTTVADLPAVLRSCDAFVGNDSFPFHLAVACGIPAVVPIGPGTRRYYDYPLGRVNVVRRPLVCSPRHGEECPYMVTCPHAACMQAIRVDDVRAAVTDVLPRTPSPE